MICQAYRRPEKAAHGQQKTNHWTEQGARAFFVSATAESVKWYRRCAFRGRSLPGFAWHAFVNWRVGFRNSISRSLDRMCAVERFGHPVGARPTRQLCGPWAGFCTNGPVLD